jgi:hypothetical protein
MRAFFVATAAAVAAGERVASVATSRACAASHKSVQLAVAELRRYVYLIDAQRALPTAVTLDGATGATLDADAFTAWGAAGEGGVHLFVGTAACLPADSALAAFAPTSTHTEAYAVTTTTLQAPTGGSVAVHALIGNTPAGALFAAYDYLERLGVGFSTSGPSLPAQRTHATAIPTLPTTTVTEEPIFTLRGLQPFHDFAEGPDWVRWWGRRRGRGGGGRCVPRRGARRQRSLASSLDLPGATTPPCSPSRSRPAVERGRVGPRHRDDRPDEGQRAGHAHLPRGLWRRRARGVGGPAGAGERGRHGGVRHVRHVVGQHAARRVGVRAAEHVGLPLRRGGAVRVRLLRAPHPVGAGQPVPLARHPR